MTRVVAKHAAVEYQGYFLNSGTGRRPMQHTPSEFVPVERAVLASPLLTPVLERWDQVALPDSWLIAGAVAQTFWNLAHSQSPSHGIKDVDIAYFDDTDLSAQAEEAHAARINAAFSKCSIHFDVKNEARVHLWYERKFGYAIRPYISAPHAIATFPTTATSVGIRPTSTGLAFCAPFGVHDLLRLVVRPNKVQITAEIYAAKVSRWKAIWPRLQIIDWSSTRIGPVPGAW